MRGQTISKIKPVESIVFSIVVDAKKKINKNNVG